jgi:2-polyprenyl-6-methoxyphenol hydroxylase-like FAD-dependent oxidoreductase
MGALWMGIAAWVKAAQATGAAAEDAAQLARFVKGLRSQHRYATLRGYIAGKRYAVVNDDLSAVTIKDGQYSKTVQFEFNGRPLAGQPNDETDFSGSTDGGNQGGGSVDPNPVNPETPAGESFTIAAGVGADGGGSVTIKKNGAVVEGGSVQASASDTVVLQAVPENENFQFMSWSDGNSQNPRTIQPSADMNVTANFLDLSKI